MEKDDRSPQTTEVSEETRGGEKDKGELHLLRRTLQKALHTFIYLGEKTKSIYTNLFSSEGGASPLDDIKGAFSHIPLRRRGVKYLLVGIVLAVYFLSGLYTVKPGEEAVARIFGKEVRHQISEGLHYHLPWPFEAVEKVNVMEIRRVDLGVPGSKKPILFPRERANTSEVAAGAHSGHGGHGAHGSPSQRPTPSPDLAKNQFLTGDENILEIRMIIQYRIKDASDYLFKVDSPDSLASSAARAAVTGIFGSMQVDDLLTVAKSQIQNRIARSTQQMLDDYGAGLQIVNVNLQEVNPPKGVAQAFRDVASAREEREEKINKAQGYRNAVIPEARGNAHKLVSDAQGYREEVMNRASGDAEKFTAMLKEYRRAKNITEYRLYLETMEKVLAKVKKFVVDSKKERVNLKFVK